jgi:hypothetical protein
MIRLVSLSLRLRRRIALVVSIIRTLPLPCFLLFISSGKKTEEAAEEERATGAYTAGYLFVISG